MAEQYYLPLFNYAYLKNSTGYPPTLNSITDLKACKVDDELLASPSNPILKGVVGRHNVRCLNGRFTQTVLILRMFFFLFLFFYSHIIRDYYWLIFWRIIYYF